MIGSPLRHRSLLVRLAALTGLGVALHLAAWTVGYHLLPPEALRGVFLTSEIPVVGGSEGSTLSRILVVNLVFGVGLVVVANLFRVGRFPLGFVPVLFHWTAFGLFQGTGSFSVATAPRPPSIPELVASRGTWEILAYTIVGAATIGLFVYRQRSWLDWTTRKERALTDVSLSAAEWAATGVALALLVAANWTEARSLTGL